MTYRDAIAYLDSFVNYEHHRDAEAMREVQLERMRRLCQRLGDPHRGFRSILVAGTNGKGSICAMLYAMLRASPLRVGLYTSPHIEHLRERIRVWPAPAVVSGGPGSAPATMSDGPGPASAAPVHAQDWIGEDEFAALMGELQPIVESMRQESSGSVPTYFEILTTLAFLYFHRRGVEVAILEVGLGGRLDATNIVDQAVSIIAPISLDHVEILGADLVSIAREKAGIIKPHQTVFTAAQLPEVAAVLRETCEAQGVPLLVCGRDVTAKVHHHGVDGLQVSLTGLRGLYEALDIPLLGRHQADNAALAVGALEAFSNSGVPYSLVERGLSAIEWPGRLEVAHESPLVIMDGAHNPHAMAALCETLQELCEGRKIHVLIGMSSDKSVEQVGQTLGQWASGVTCTRSSHPRALHPTLLAGRLVPYFPDVHVMSDPVDAYTYLLNAIAPTDVLVVTGSLFLVGELHAKLRRAHVRIRRAVTEPTA